MTPCWAACNSLPDSPAARPQPGLVWDPAVLLLDEATAAVDSASEATRAALRAAVMGCGRTVLTVAHRLYGPRSRSCPGAGGWSDRRRRCTRALDPPRRTVCRPGGAGNCWVGLADRWASLQAVSNVPWQARKNALACPNCYGDVGVKVRRQVNRCVRNAANARAPVM